MPRGRVLVGLLVWAALGGCERRDRPPTAPNARERADVAPTQKPAAEVCARACDRFRGCTGELASAYGADAEAVSARFLFACDEECSGLEGTARGELGRVDDCTALDSCIAFYTCATGDPPPLALSTITARTPAPTCASLCARERRCRDQAQATAEEAESACVLSCEAAAQAQSPLPCGTRRTCGGLLGCVDGWRDSGYARERDAPPPGVSPVCDELCTRAIRCGAEASGEPLAEAELAELRDTMSSTYMECALQCGEDLRQDDGARFQKCLAKAECKAFEECADAL